MADGLVSMSDQFKGLPMESLIGGPLTAACNANLTLAKSTANFIDSVGFELDADGNTLTDKPRMAEFSFERPNQISDGSYLVEKVDIKVPMLAIVPIPNLQIDNVDVTFDMEVKSSTSDTKKQDSEAAMSGSAKVGWGPFSVSVTVSGKTSCHQEHVRTSDNSAKYHVAVHASNAGIPEGLARVLDMMVEAAKPRQIKQISTITKNDKGELIEGDGK